MVLDTSYIGRRNLYYYTAIVEIQTVLVLVLSRRVTTPRGGVITGLRVPIVLAYTRQLGVQTLRLQKQTPRCTAQTPGLYTETPRVSGFTALKTKRQGVLRKLQVYIQKRQGLTDIRQGLLDRRQRLVGTCQGLMNKRQGEHQWSMWLLSWVCNCWINQSTSSGNYLFCFLHACNT